MVIENVHHIGHNFAAALDPLGENLGRKFFVGIENVVKVAQGRIFNDIRFFNVIYARFFDERTKVQFSLVFRDVKLNVFFVKLFHFIFVKNSAAGKDPHEFLFAFNDRRIDEEIIADRFIELDQVVPDGEVTLGSLHPDIVAVSGKSG